jgi:gas vesicle protein
VTTCIIAALDEAMPLWLAALIPAIVYAAGAGVLALRGRNKVRQAGPPGARANNRKREGGRAMGQDPRAIRQDIEQTRERMGDTVEAMGHKTDVTGRAKEAISDRVDSRKGKVTGVGSTISDSTPDGTDVKEGARKAAGIGQENPLGLALGAVAVGFVAGLLIPATRVEDEKLGPMADQVKDKAKATGEEAVERGKEVAQQAAQSAKETAQQAGQEHAEGLKDSAQKAQEPRQQAGTTT